MVGSSLWAVSVGLFWNACGVSVATHGEVNIFWWWLRLFRMALWAYYVWHIKMILNTSPFNINQSFLWVSFHVNSVGLLCLTHFSVGLLRLQRISFDMCVVPQSRHTEGQTYLYSRLTSVPFSVSLLWLIRISFDMCVVPRSRHTER